MGIPSILIVEDDAVIRQLLFIRLSREPLHVETATDGMEALQRLAGARYALLLLDLMMARMNGFEVIEALRHQETRPLVFVMTALDETMTRTIDGRIVQAVWRKPFDLERLVEVVRECAVGWEARTPLMAGPCLFSPRPRSV